jgi:hypothetical protein
MKIEFTNLIIETASPLSQFEIRDIVSLNAPILGNFHFALTNIGLFLSLGAFFLFILNLLSTNYNKLVGNG